MSTFFTDDESEEFRDIPDEVSGQDAPDASVRVNRPAQPVQATYNAIEEQVSQDYQELTEDLDEEQDFSSILSDARQRMEQGRIYEVLMDHDLFSGQGFDEKAVKFVTKQIRTFAKEQMEIMLGMRQEKPKAGVLAASDFPFNDVEVLALKDLAYMATKGASASEDVQTFTPRASAPMIPVAPRRTGLNPIASKVPAKAPTKPTASAKPLQSKPAAPVKRSRTELEIEQILAEEGISREEYERQYNPNYKPLDKPFNQMSEAEVKERALALKQRHPGQVKNSQAIPMPTPEQEEMLHTQRAQAASANPQMQSIMNLLMQQKK